jgi:hypothetical protein
MDPNLRDGPRTLKPQNRPTLTTGARASVGSRNGVRIVDEAFDIENGLPSFSDFKRVRASRQGL